MGVTYTGKQLIRDLLSGASSSNLSHMAWGAGSAAFHDSQSVLGSELFPSGAGAARNVFSSVVGIDKPRQEIYYGELLSEQANIGSISEIGLFNASSGGTLFCRRVFYRVEKTTDIELQEEYSISVEQQ